MTTVHDDRPHPIPPFAYLRYKENYFFIILAEKCNIYGVSHLNFEPGFDRARFTCNLCVDGELIKYGNETKLPATFELAEEIGDGHLTLRFIDPHERFDLSLASNDVDMTLSFKKRLPTFDYAACRTAAPEMANFQEVLTFGLNLPYNHQQQSMNVDGSITVRRTGKSKHIDGVGYRDHSWVMRADHVVAAHSWCAFNFADRAFGIKMISTLHRPNAPGREGYVGDKDGVRALRSIDVRFEGDGPNGQPATVVHDVADVYGNRYTIQSDIAGRLGHVPLLSEAAGHKPAYLVVENFVHAVLLQTGEQGIALVELGRNPLTKK